MILKGSQRSGGKQLGLHLLREDQNEHVEVHEVSGFVSETVLGAMKEALALSKGTRCQQYLFSVSLNPPAAESAGVEVFERALRLIEEKMGLVDQPRVVVFHEKEGRRHCHAVWSRIDAQTMSANAAHGGRRAKEDDMFRYTRGDLAKKTNTQLSALFNLATSRLSGLSEPEAETAEAISLLAMIRDEMHRRFQP